MEKKERLVCKNGHPWVVSNVYVDPRSGKESCRACRRVKARKRYANKYDGLDQIDNG